MPDPVTAITTGHHWLVQPCLLPGRTKQAKFKSKPPMQPHSCNAIFTNQNREDLAPYRQTGTAAQNRLAYLMGLSPSGQSTSSTPPTREQLVAQLTPKYTTSTNGNWYVNGKGQLVDVSKYMIWNQ